MAGSARRPLAAAAAVAITLLSGRALSARARPDEPAAVRLQEPETSITWRAIDARATLDRDGVLHVRERLTLAVTGETVTVTRVFRPWLTSRITLASIARVDPATGALRPLAPGAPVARDQYQRDVFARDRFQFADDWLRWGTRAPDDPVFGRDTLLSCQIDYVVTGSVIPIWGVRGFGTSSLLSDALRPRDEPAGFVERARLPRALELARAVAGPVFGALAYPRARAWELWQAWRLAPGGLRNRYLLDFDFSPFPFNASEPIGRFSLDLRLDPAWRPLAMPRSVRAPVAAGEDLRDLVPLEFSAPGTPAGVHRMSHAIWVAPLVLVPGIVVALVGFRIGHAWSQKRRLNRIPVDEAWVRQQLLVRPTSEIRRLATQTDGSLPPYFGAPGFLEDMERDGTIALQGPPDSWVLRLRASRERLSAEERAFVKTLFGERDSVSAAETQKWFAQEGDEIARAALAVFRAAYRVQPSVPARLRRGAGPVLIGLGVVVALATDAPAGFFALVTALVFGGLVILIGGLRPRIGVSLEIPLPRLALVTVPAAILLPLAQVGFFLMMPAPAGVIVGQGLMWLGFASTVVNGTIPRWTAPEVELRHQLSRARDYIGAELGKRHPALDDAWLPWILALGLKNAVESWRRGRGMFAARAAGPGVASDAGWTAAAAPSAAQGWAYPFLHGFEGMVWVDALAGLYYVAGDARIGNADNGQWMSLGAALRTGHKAASA